MTDRSELLIVAPPELAAGFILAGARTRTASSVEEASDLISDLMEHERGVIAVYAPYLDGLPDDEQTSLEASLRPIVVRIPTGRDRADGESRRARLAERLQRAIGYRISFGGDEE